MVIGNGLIARLLKKYDKDNKILIFASGVSNSREEKPDAFLRERLLLKDSVHKFQAVKFIYFSTCSIYDTSLNNSLYIAHKLTMEALIKDNHSNFLILRLPNIIGHKGNKATIINYLIDTIKNDVTFPAWKNASRNILGQDDLLNIFSQVVKENKNTTLNIASPYSFSIMELIEQVELFLSKKARAEYLEKGMEYHIDISKIEHIVNNTINCTREQYLPQLLQKYY